MERLYQAHRSTYPRWFPFNRKSLLHNNPAELGARQRVRKRDVSFGPRTTDGADAWDTFMTLVATAKKLGVSFYAYVYDRVAGVNALPNLADIIKQRSPASHPILSSPTTWSHTPVYWEDTFKLWKYPDQPCHRVPKPGLIWIQQPEIQQYNARHFSEAENV